MAGIVLCSISALNPEMVWVMCSNYGSKHIQIPRRMVAAYGLLLKDRGFGTFENLQRERYSAMNDAGVSGPIVV